MTAVNEVKPTPLPPLPEPYSLAHEDAGSFWPDTYSESQMQAYAQQARADLEAELKQWKNVFGHLGTADECGNEWIRLQDENQRLREALEEIISYEHDWETLVEDLRHIAHEALEKQP